MCEWVLLKKNLARNCSSQSLRYGRLENRLVVQQAATVLPAATIFVRSGHITHCSNKHD